MLDFGDELTFQSFKIPWLLWIQLFVFLLLLALLFCFSIVALDPSHETVASSAPTTSDFHLQSHSTNNHSTPVTNRLLSTRGTENLSTKGEIAATTSTETVKEQIAEGEASSLYFLHPCYYFKLARVAFLKCLGLDSTPEPDGPSPQKHMKSKES